MSISAVGGPQPIAAAPRATDMSGSGTRPLAANGTSTAATAAPNLNPDPVIDPSLGIVVLQYFSGGGQETHSFPTRQQLDQYQIYGLGTPKPSTTAAAVQNPTPTPTATGGGP